MRTVGILTLILVIGTSVSTEPECRYSKYSGFWKASCERLKMIPKDLTYASDIQVLDLAENQINMLTNDSFDSYPNLRRLQLAANKVHTIDPGALADLAELEWLDLSENSITRAPAGLPPSLQELILNRNPVSADMRALATAAGLHTLRLQWQAGDEEHGLSAYPEFGPMPGLVALDVSLNRRIRDAEPRQLAATCRLARLNVTGTGLFPAGAHCRCRRFVQWTAEYKIAVTGLPACPEPGDGGPAPPEDDDPANENCTRTPDDALAAYRECMKKWDRQNSSFWSAVAGLTVAAAVVSVLLCVCVRRRRSRRRHVRGRADNNGKPLPVPAADCGGAKDNDCGNAQQTAGDAATAPGHKAADPAALLS